MGTLLREPLREWIKDAENIDKIASSPSLILKKVAAQKIFGLNLTLQSRVARGIAEKQWASIAKAHCLVGKKSISSICVCLYNLARTHFIRNS